MCAVNTAFSEALEHLHGLRVNIDFSAAVEMNCDFTTSWFGPSKPVCPLRKNKGAEGVWRIVVSQM
jgi:hypothetical protein